MEEIRRDFSRLGSSYWLGALGWVMLLVVETIVFIAEQAVVPDLEQPVELNAPFVPVVALDTATTEGPE